MIGDVIFFMFSLINMTLDTDSNGEPLTCTAPVTGLPTEEVMGTRDFKKQG